MGNDRYLIQKSSQSRRLRGVLKKEIGLFSDEKCFFFVPHYLITLCLGLEEQKKE